MFRTQLDPPLTAQSQSTSTSSSPLFPSHWTPTATQPFGRFPEQSLLTGYEPNAPQHLLFYLGEGAVSNLCVIASLPHSMRRRRVKDRTWEGWPHYCFHRIERQVLTHSEFITQIERVLMHLSLTWVPASRNRQREVRTKKSPVETKVLCVILS